MAKRQTPATVLSLVVISASMLLSDENVIEINKHQENFDNYYGRGGR